MNRYKICAPNDFGSEDNLLAAIGECYDGEREACDADDGRLIYDVISMAARAAGEWPCRN